MGGERALWVVARERGADVHTGEVLAFGGEIGDLVVRELGAQGQRLVGVPVFEQVVEALQVGGTDAHYLTEGVKSRVEVGRKLRHDIQLVGRTVLRERHAVAVEDETPRRHNGLGAQPVALGARSEERRVGKECRAWQTY